MTSVGHNELTADQLHVAFRWVQEGDPGGGTDHPGHYWVKLSTGEIKRRKDDDSGWTLLGGSAGGVTAADFTAKGDLLAGTGSGAYTHLGVGTDGFFVRAHSAAGTGLQYYDHEGAADPHPNYALDTDLADYQLKSTLTAKGDLYVATASGVIARLPVGTNGDVLTADSGATPGVSWQAGGGGGGVTNLRTTYASRPAAGTAGRLWVATDSLLNAFDDGAAWHEYYGSSPVKATNGFPSTWVNQGTATSDVTKGGLFVYAPVAGGANARLLVKTAPTAPYTITIGVIPQVFDVNFHEMGLILRDSGSGKFVSLLTSVGVFAQGSKWTDPNTFNSSYFSIPNHIVEHIYWLRITDDATNRIYSISTNGIFFTPLFSVGHTDFLTPDQVGVYVDCNNATYDAAAYFVSWDEA